MASVTPTAGSSRQKTNMNFMIISVLLTVNSKATSSEAEIKRGQDSKKCNRPADLDNGCLLVLDLTTFAASGLRAGFKRPAHLRFMII